MPRSKKDRIQQQQMLWAPSFANHCHYLGFDLLCILLRYALFNRSWDKYVTLFEHQTALRTFVCLRLWKSCDSFVFLLSGK